MSDNWNEKKKLKIYEFRIFLPLQNSRLQLSLQESLVDEFMVRGEKKVGIMHLEGRIFVELIWGSS